MEQLEKQCLVLRGAPKFSKNISGSCEQVCTNPCLPERMVASNDSQDKYSHQSKAPVRGLGHKADKLFKNIATDFPSGISQIRHSFSDLVTILGEIWSLLSGT